MTNTPVEVACRILAGICSTDEPLGELTTYRVGGTAAVMVRPRSIDDLGRVAEALAVTGLAVLVVGRGSNLLVADEGFRGIAVVLDDMTPDPERIEIVTDSREATVEVGAAAALPVVARRTVAAGLAGFEWAVGVPGSIGGAVRMNAGGHGSDMATSLESAQVFDLHHARWAWVGASSLGLRFRGSDLADHQIVLAARLRLSVRPTGEAEIGDTLLADIVRWRREHQPGGHNAGSVFVNPIPDLLPAARLIDEAGLRGFRIGGACVSTKHANFIQADDGATAADVRAVMETVRRRVHERTGHLLRSEIRLVGFDDVADEVGPGVQW
ncbi:MAG: UDP-N-acetylmuramate dehydrogenase [Ilumatobacteraceae bacterium]